LGVDGGNNGAMAYSVILRADGSEEIIPSKVVTWFAKGDRLIVETAGGGGYGAPLDREKDANQTDIDNGKISQDGAAGKYGFPLQPSART
jgi:N-methylhydantoinase B